MASYSVALPLELDDGDGFVMIKSIKKLIRQNLKMLLLTDPGERVMDPDFGVGLKQFLFENYGSGIESQIDSKIREQVNIYLPVISIMNIAFGIADADNNRLAFSIIYSIPNIGDRDFLEITI
jgi:phage baseplate assembly protein W|tara:strand:- start:5827 stop:6195 length:369 start_codon:yes stop_codon:yes gene_type:complete